MARRSNRAMYREAKGLPATLRPGRPVVALCRWEDFNYGRPVGYSGPRYPYWLPRDEPATACRASLGDERLNVWLPQGARIIVRLFSCTPMAQTYTHVFGSHERCSRTRIVIRLTEYPTS